MDRRRMMAMGILGGGASDVVAPTVTITCAQTSPSVTTPLNFTFTLSESSSDFAIGDITVGNGTAGNFAGSGTSYTCDITPTAGGAVTVDVAAGAFHDAAGNENEAATQFSITYIALLLNDVFTTNDAAPIATPRTCEPGPGGITIVDSGNKVSIASNKLARSDVAVTAFTDPRLYGTTGYTRAAGLCFSYLVRTDTSNFNDIFGFLGNVAGGSANLLLAMYGFGVTLRIWNKSTEFIDSVKTLANATNYRGHSIARSTGGLLIIGSTLEWVFNTDTTTPLYPAWAFSNGAGESKMDDWKVASLPAPFNDDYGIATQRLAGARTAGDTFVHTADVWLEFTCTTRPSAGNVDFRFRKQDDTNYWQITIDSTGALTLNEVVAGTPTQRATAAGVVTSGHRIVIVAEGQIIKCFSNNTLRWTYSSAANFATATAGVLSDEGTGGSVTEIIAWPRTLTGTALAALQALNP